MGEEFIFITALTNYEFSITLIFRVFSIRIIYITFMIFVLCNKFTIDIYFNLFSIISSSYMKPFTSVRVFGGLNICQDTITIIRFLGRNSKTNVIVGAKNPTFFKTSVVLSTNYISTPLDESFINNPSLYANCLSRFVFKVFETLGALNIIVLIVIEFNSISKFTFYCF